jgi:hypothetical protein
MVNSDLIIHKSADPVSRTEVSDPATGLRAYFVDRQNTSQIPQSWVENSCGFYILLSNLREDDSFDVLVGKVTKGFAGMLKLHDDTNSFWKTAILIKSDTEFSINQSAYLEGKIREILIASESVTVRNIRPSWDNKLFAPELLPMQSAIRFTLSMLSLRGYMNAEMVETAIKVTESITSDYNALESPTGRFPSMPRPPLKPVFNYPVISSQSPMKSSGTGIAEPSQEDLFKALKAWRTGRAADEKVPAYVITNNRTLEDIATIKPADKDELIKIQGMGKMRVERYGEEILRIVSSSDPLAA